MHINEEISTLIAEFEKPIKKWKNYKVLVTGSTGHLGYYFSNFLLQSNKYLDLNLDLTFTSKGLMDNSFVKYKSDYVYAQGNILDEDFIDDLGEFDCIIHLAGYAQPSIFIADPISTIKINTEIVSCLLKKINPLGSFLFLSSSEVYANTQISLNQEDMNTCINSNHPRAAYILSKLMGESICFAESTNSNKNIKIARLSMVYGPGIKKNDKRVISQFLHQAVFDDKIKLLDQGKAQREYLYILDAVRALLNILFFGKESIYNIGAGVSGSISIVEVAKTIANLADVHVELPNNDINYLGARNQVGLDISRYESEFGCPLQTTFKIGISNTFNWVQDDWTI
jgi:dTDP-glucose 4,6-dehydratase/UDP-glucuronate decarboxylase